MGQGRLLAWVGNKRIPKCCCLSPKIFLLVCSEIPFLFVSKPVVFSAGLLLQHLTNPSEELCHIEGPTAEIPSDVEAGHKLVEDLKDRIEKRTGQL